MFANYHAHTYRCRHASGTQREYVEEAIRAGFKVFGFSDHTPYPFNNGYESGFRMSPAELEGYVRETLDLRDEYKDDIEIHVGLEAEYYPKHFEDLLRLCEQYPVEYLLLGQHFLGNEYDGVHSAGRNTDETVLKAFCDQMGEALDTGKFLYVAHPDMFRFQGDEALYEKYMHGFCRKMKACGVPGEINFLGLLEDRHYPNPKFWRIAGEEGLDVVFGLDAHAKDRIDLPQCEEKARKIVAENGLHLIERIL